MPKIIPSTPRRIYDAVAYSLSPIKFILKAFQQESDFDGPIAGPSNSSSPGTSHGTSSTKAQPRRRANHANRREVQRLNSIRKERSFKTNERPNHANLDIEKLGAVTAAAISENIASLDPSHRIIAEQINKLFQQRNTMNRQLAAKSSPTDSSQAPPPPPPSSTNPRPRANNNPPPASQPTNPMPRRPIRIHSAGRSRKQDDAAKAFAAKKAQEYARRKLDAELDSFRSKYHQHAQEAESGLGEIQRIIDNLNQGLTRILSMRNSLRFPEPHRIHRFSNNLWLNSIYDDVDQSYRRADKDADNLIKALQSLISAEERRSKSWLQLRSTLSALWTAFHSSTSWRENSRALFKEVKLRQRDCAAMKPLTLQHEKVELLAKTFQTSFALAQTQRQAYDGKIMEIVENMKRAERERALEEELSAARAQKERIRREEGALRDLEKRRRVAAEKIAKGAREQARRQVEEASRLAAEARRVAEEQAAYRAQAEWERAKILEEARAHFAGYQGYHNQGHQSAGPIPVDVSMRTVCDEPEPHYNYNDVSMADCTAPPSPPLTPQEPPRPQSPPHFAQETPHPKSPLCPTQETPPPSQSAPSQEAHYPTPPPSQQTPPPAPTPIITPYPTLAPGIVTIKQYLALHEARWKVLRSSSNTTPISFQEMPWPVLSEVNSLDDLTTDRFEAFYQEVASGKSSARVVKEALLRFHPDKFSKLEAKVAVGYLDDVRAGMALVTHYLNDIRDRQ